MNLLPLAGLLGFFPPGIQSQRIVVPPKVVGHAETDLDHDGRTDIVLAVVPEDRSREREILIFLQKERGRFAEVPELRIPVKRDVLAWAVGDLLPDRGAEILFLTRSAAFAFVPRSAEYRENVRKIATFESLFEMPDPSDLPRWPYLLGARGGGRPELLVPERGRLRIFGPSEEEPLGEWVERSVIGAQRSPADERRRGVRRQGRSVSISFGAGEPRLGFEKDPFLVVPGEERRGGDLLSISNSLPAPVLADSDRDGLPDLYLLRGGTVRIHRQDAAGSFSPEPSWSGTLRKDRDWPEEVRVRDLDGDGRAELIALGSEEGDPVAGSQILEVLRGGPEGPSLAPPATRLKFEGYRLYVECADVDGDGALDLAVSIVDLPATPDALVTGARPRWTYHVFRGSPGGVEREPCLRFTEEWPPESYVGVQVIATFGADVDGDGLRDFVRAAPDGTLAAFPLARSKSGRLERGAKPLFELSLDRVATDMAAFPLDGDSRADVIVFHEGGFTTVLPR